MDVNTLWKERASSFRNEAFRYLRLIGNSGFMFSLYALFLAGGYFYPSFIAWLPESFPVAFAFTIVFAYLLTRTPLRTFLKEGDVVFLLPLETKMHPFFQRSLIYSICVQFAAVAFLFLILGPLFQDRITDEMSYFFLVFLFLFLSKWWNNAAKWVELRLQDQRERRFSTVGRFVINVIYLYFLFVAVSLPFTIVILIIKFVLYVLYYRRLLAHHPLKWTLLLEEESDRTARFYRFVQSFTDVPYMKAKVKRRRMLSALSDFFVWKRKNIYDVMFWKAFLRSGEYLGIYVRLLFVGSLVMYAFPSEWVRLAVALLFLYMTSVQLKTIRFHYDVLLWPDLYPVSPMDKKKAFVPFMQVLLLMQTCLFTVVYFIVGESFRLLFLLFILGLLFSWMYPSFRWQYGKEKMREV